MLMLVLYFWRAERRHARRDDDGHDDTAAEMRSSHAWMMLMQHLDDCRRCLFRTAAEKWPTRAERRRLAIIS